MDRMKFIDRKKEIKEVAEKNRNKLNYIISRIDSEIILIKTIDEAKLIVKNNIENKQILDYYKYSTFEVLELASYDNRFTEFNPEVVFEYVDKLLEILKEELLIQIDLYPKNRITLNLNDLVITKVLIDYADEDGDLEYKFKTHNGNIKTVSHSYADEYTEEETFKLYQELSAE